MNKNQNTISEFVNLYKRGIIDEETLSRLLISVSENQEGFIGHIIGQYRILEKIGEGGMGTVYLARHIEETFAQLTGNVAIKVIHRDLIQNEQVKKRFINEAAASRALRHPNIVPTHDILIDTKNNVFAFVMDFLEGNTLDHFICTSMQFKIALPMIEQLCSAVDYIHKQGLIHRDLKPSNIMISEDRKVHILDMGLVKNKNWSLVQTLPDSTVGTFLYMAPEQMTSSSVSEAADRYSLGLIVYQILSGTLPWSEDASASTIVYQKSVGQLIPLRDHLDISQGISDIVMRLLSNTPSERWENCRTFYNALSEAVLSQRKTSQYHDSLAHFTGVQKTAILIMYLDRDISRRILENFSAAEVKEVSMAMAELGPIRKQEIEAVIEEFFSKLR